MTESNKPHNSSLERELASCLDIREQLALTIDRMPLGYIVWDAAFRVLTWNPAAQKIFGWSADEVLGRRVSELMLPGADVPPDCMRKAVEQSGKTVQSVCAGVSKSGRRVVCEWYNTPVRDASGNVRALISQIRDITGTDQTDRELRESRKYLQTIIDSEPECVKLLNPDCTLIMMNRAGLDMIQAESLDQIKGKPVCPMIGSVHRQAFTELTRRVFEGQSGTLMFEMQGLKGRRLWLETHAVPLRNDRDEIVALLGITRDVTERKKAEEVLKKERDFTNAVLDTIGSIVLVLDRNGTIVRFNRMCEEVSGYTVQETIGRHVWDFLVPPEQVEAVKGVFRNLVAGSFPNRYENYWIAKDGSRRLIAWSNTVLLAPDGSVEFVLPTGIDITEHRRLEEQFRQSQKMESIGTLAGGVAHDFNNILTAIIGYGSLLQMKMSEKDPLRHHVEQILSSANRASTLTQGLLSYSRKQVLNALPVDLNVIIKKIELLLVRLLGEDVELKTVLTDRNVTVMADPGQIEQLLMNLATNARDAMPEGGNLFIETEQLTLDPQAAKAHELGKPGTFAVIAMTDSGTGIDAKTRDRIFDPFFTTKEPGRGTGLGLATCYSIAKQHDGLITVDSEVGRGTTFRVFLPLVPVPQQQELPAERPAIVGGSETLLVAEDDEIVRELTCHMLEQFGYRVIKAVDGEDAVNKFMENRTQVRLLLLDVIMPKKNGREVCSKIRIFEPGIKALFLSGYTEDVIQHRGLLEPGFDFIMKPVPVNDLLRKIRILLDEARP